MKRKTLKLFRISQDLTQEEMANKIGYCRAQYALIERGKRDGTQEFWKRLQDTFNIDDADMWTLMREGN